MVLRWIVANLASNGQPLDLASPARVWAIIGWQFLLYVSVITIIGWAWVITAWMRWICRNIDGTRREVIFIGTGLEFLWRTIVFAIACIFIIPIPWVYALVRRSWLRVADSRLADADGASHANAYTSLTLRWRTEPSCATDATSVPSGLKIRPRVKPRPPCALGESCA